MYNDIAKANTIEKLKQQYKLDSNQLKQAIQQEIAKLNKVENELNNYIKVVTKNLENLQNQVDGNITTWFFSGVPTLENKPAEEWTDTTEKDKHIGDLYYDQETGYAYRFQLVNNVYSWNKLTDNDVTEALALANAAKDTADSKRRVFITQPSPPYDNGDFWINNNEIYICQIAKQSGEFNSNDFINSLKYTDDTKAEEVDGKLTIVSGKVTTIEKDVNSISQKVEDNKYYVDSEGNKQLISSGVSNLEQNTKSISYSVSSMETNISDLQKSIDYFSVDLEQNSLVIPTDSLNKPMETKDYLIKYYGYYKGQQIIPTLQVIGTNTGINVTTTSTGITISVNSETAISNSLNEYSIKFTYNEEELIKKINISLAIQGQQGSKGEQGIQGEKGEPGEQGVPGSKGEDGVSTYFYVKYSADSSGNPMTNIPDENTQYMGVASTTSTTAPTSYSAYTWSKIKGNTGDVGSPGQAGTNGQTSYLHIKYSEDGETFTPAETDYALGEKPSAYIGQYVDFTEQDSTNFDDYNWYKFTENIDPKLDNLDNQISNINDNLNNNYYKKEQINKLIVDAESGLTNIFTQSGGSNLLRNTAPWYMKSENTGEYWTGNLKQMVEPEAKSGFAILTQQGTLSQTIQIPTKTVNGVVEGLICSISFKYKRLVDGAEGTIKYNGRTINLGASGEIHTSGEVKQVFTIEIIANSNNGFEIYDLMMKYGEEGANGMLLWTQNANESYSETVQIGEGITAISSTTDTKATMNSDGFRVRNKTTGESVMEGTSTGGKLRDLTVTNNSRISGLIIRKSKTTGITSINGEES